MTTESFVYLARAISFVLVIQWTVGTFAVVHQHCSRIAEMFSIVAHLDFVHLGQNILKTSPVRLSDKYCWSNTSLKTLYTLDEDCRKRDFIELRLMLSKFLLCSLSNITCSLIVVAFGEVQMTVLRRSHSPGNWTTPFSSWPSSVTWKYKFPQLSLVLPMLPAEVVLVISGQTKVIVNCGLCIACSSHNPWTKEVSKATLDWCSH